MGTQGWSTGSPAPGEENVGIVILFLRHFTNPVGEVQRLPKTVEPILLFEMMLVDDRSSPIQLREQRVELGALQG